MNLLLQISFFLSWCSMVAFGDPPFCTRGFKLASRFHQCWEQATFGNEFPALHQPHESVDQKFVEAYATHMCSVVKPVALKCLHGEVEECNNVKKIMAIADNSGGACEGDNLSPFFKKYVIEHLVPVKGDSPCFDLADNTYECYTAAGQKVMESGSQSDNIVTFHRVADKFFNAYWECMVEIYKSNIKICPNWQIPMLLTLQKTAMPSLFGLRLQPEQVRKLELSMNDEDKEALDRGPSTLYLLLQLHKDRPEVSDSEDSVVIELTDLNDENPHLGLQIEEGETDTGGEPKPHEFTLGEIKKILREQRRRNKELKEFINQAKGSKKEKGGKGGKKKKTEEKKWGKKKSKSSSSYKSKSRSNTQSGQKRLHHDSMIA